MGRQDVDDDRDAYLAMLEVDHDDPSADEPYEEPKGDEEANVLLRRLRFHERCVEELDASVRAERERLAAFYTDRTAGHLRQIERAAQALEGFMRGAHAIDPRVKTKTLPNGVARIRATPPRVAVADAELVEVWADSANAEGLVVKEPKVAAKAVKHWCIPGEPLELPRLDGFQLRAAVFVPALIVNAFHFAWSGVPKGLPLTVPGLRFDTPTRPSFSYETAKPPARAEEETPDA